MYILHNNFDYHAVVAYIATDLDIPEPSVEQLQIYLTRWFEGVFEDDYEGATDPLFEIVFRDISFEGIAEVRVLPATQSLVKWVNVDDELTSVEFPIILMEM